MKMMSKKLRNDLFFIFFIYLIVFACEVGSSEFRQLQARKNVELQNFYPTDTALKIYEQINSSKIQCSDLCLRIDNCKSFFFHDIQLDCHVFDKEFTTNDIISSVSWMYYIVEKGISQNPCLPKTDYTFISEFNICFKIYSTPVYTTAGALSSNCPSDGAELIKIDSQAIQDYFSTELGKIGESFTYALIQGNDNAEENVWKYDDGTPMSFFYWNTNPLQPDTSTQQNIIGLSRTYNFKWHDIDSSFSYIFVYICQITVP